MHPERSGEIDIRIDREGRWYTRARASNASPGGPLRHDPAFRDQWLLPRYPGGEDENLVEGAFIAVDLDVRGSGKIVAAVQHQWGLYHCRQGAPHTHAGRTTFHIGEVSLEARIQRSVFYRLVEEGEAHGDDLLVYSDGQGFNLGSLVA